MKQPAPTVIYIDDHILIADKPSGITVIPERYNTEKPSVQSLLEKDHGKLWVVHRIDRETTGIVAFARNEEAHKNLSRQFENREVHKLYKAIVSGRMEGEAGEIDSPIAEKPNKPGTMMIHPKGKEALTLFDVEEQFRTCALLNVEIKTGRTHQIRVHFASAGHPLLVDSVYGQHDKFLLSSVKRKYKQTDEDERPVISRLTLHASSLTIHHPATGEQMTFTSPVPHDLEALLKLLRKYDK
ncbi:MAG: RluA family pseudouridine synthase [Bacteroidetes bacterium]|nr:RluA family pseudouridine synthase [Bacteroidota bacterium]